MNNRCIKAWLTVCAGSLLISCTAFNKQSEDGFHTQIDGEDVNLYHLSNSRGMEMTVTNYGGRVVKLVVPNKDGQPEDVVLGFDTVQEYRESSEAYFGAAIGRYGNRIANGRFTLDGEEYQLAQNNGPNSLQSTVLTPKETYTHSCVYKFSLDQ